MRKDQTSSQVEQTNSTFKSTFRYCFNKLGDQLLQPFWLCSSGVVSLAIVLSGSPAWAEAKLEAQLSIPGDSSPDAFLNPTLEVNLNEIALSESAPNAAANSDLNNDDDGVISDKAIQQASTQILPVALAEPVHSAEAATPPTRPSTESPELAEPVPRNSIAQVDAPESQPAESQLSEPEPQPAEPEPSESEPQPAEASPTSASGGWQFSVEPYFFAPLDVNADVTVTGRSTSLNLGLGDILNLDRAFDAGLRLRAQNDRLGFILDGFYLYGENSGSLGRTFSSGSIFQFVQRNSPGTLDEFVQRFEPQQIQRFVQIGRQIGLNTPVNVTADGTVSIRQITIDAAVSYRVVDTSLNRSAEETNFYPRLAIAPIAGVRTNILQQTIEVDDIRINGRTIPDRALPPIDRNFRFSRTLVEPLVGAQIDLALSEQWALGFRGDVSGFNIGARQNFTWNLILGAQYNISRNVALQLAYRFNGFDFETGEGLRRTELNLRQNGVQLNAVFRF